MDPSPPMYHPSIASADHGLCQGEILSNLVNVRLSIESVGADEPEFNMYSHPYAVLMTQDCDLEQDFAVRQKRESNDKLLPCLLFCEAMTAEEMLGRVAENSKKKWERMQIALNKNERFHFFQKIDPSCDACQIGIEELVIDFKRYFAIPTDEVYRRIELGEAIRRCRLNSPYLEHLSSRLAYFLSLIALPTDHISE